jgi:uncharacterized protein (DUF305 family)
MKRLMMWVAVLAVVPFVGLAVAACSSSGSDTSGMPGMADSGAGTSTAGGQHSAADVQFAQMMIAHHRQAVEMSTLAETRASDPELKDLAAQIKAAQDPEINQMTGWLTAWGEPTAQAGGHNMPGMGGMPGEMTEEQMQQLQSASGVDFDRLFAQMMISHHNGAIQMATQIKDGGTNGDVKALADTIITTQTAEVETLQQILDRL